MDSVDPRLLWLVAVANAVAFIAMGIDKAAARRGGSRIPERVFFGLAAFTGFIGVWLGMPVFRHKRRKRSFVLKLLLATLLNAVWVWSALRGWGG